MGRLTAWIASRRHSRRSACAHSSAGPIGRPLGFERYEERIALSTNAALEIAPVDSKFINLSEGGWIGFAFSDTTVAAMTSRSFHAATVADGAGFTVLDYTTNNGPISLGMPWNTSTAGFDADGSPEVFVTDTRVVPIPPPSVGHGGNEGGQISMTPFMGPAMLGLPSAGDSLYAARTRPALQPESLDADVDAPTSTPVDTLRGRAVVYEVAQVERRLDEDAEASDDAQVLLTSADEDGALDGSQALHRAAAQESSEGHKARQDAWLLASLPNGDVNDRPVRGDAVPMLAETDMPSKVAAAADVDQNSAAAEAAAEAIAHDAAFEQWQHDRESDLDGREVAAATADSHQRRVLGAALCVLGVLPVTKALRRHAQKEPVEGRPPQRRSTRSELA